jgi:protein O-GlcNAcase/histone acetyltransferase
VALWSKKAEGFHQLCVQVNEMYTRLTAVPNRTLLYDVYQYVWDAKETTMLLDSYIAWLGMVGDG